MAEEPGENDELSLYKTEVFKATPIHLKIAIESLTLLPWGQNSREWKAARNLLWYRVPFQSEIHYHSTL